MNSEFNTQAEVFPPPLKKHKVLIDSDSQKAILTLIAQKDKKLQYGFHVNCMPGDYTLLSANMISTAQSLLLICTQRLRSATQDNFTHFEYTFGHATIRAQTLAVVIQELGAMQQEHPSDALDSARRLLCAVQDDTSLKTPDYYAEVANDIIQSLTAICNDLSTLNWESLKSNIDKFEELLYESPGYMVHVDDPTAPFKSRIQSFPEDLQERLKALHIYLTILSFCDDLHKALSKEEAYHMRDTFVQAFSYDDGPWNMDDYNILMTLCMMVLYQLLTRRYPISKLLDPMIQLPRTPDIMEHPWEGILQDDGTSSLDPTEFPEIFQPSVASSFGITENPAEPTNHFT